MERQTTSKINAIYGVGHQKLVGVTNSVAQGRGGAWVGITWIPLSLGLPTVPLSCIVPSLLFPMFPIPVQGASWQPWG